MNRELKKLIVLATVGAMSFFAFGRLPMPSLSAGVAMGTGFAAFIAAGFPITQRLHGESALLQRLVGKMPEGWDAGRLPYAVVPIHGVSGFLAVSGVLPETASAVFGTFAMGGALALIALTVAYEIVLFRSLVFRRGESA